MIFDTSGEGLLTLFKPYQAALLEYIWEVNSSERVEVSSVKPTGFYGVIRTASRGRR